VTALMGRGYDGGGFYYLTTGSRALYSPALGAFSIVAGGEII